MYTQIIAQQVSQLNVYCRHLYFMKTGHEIHCCVFKSCECRMISVVIFRIFGIIIFCFVVAICDLVHAVGAMYGIPKVLPASVNLF